MINQRLAIARDAEMLPRGLLVMGAVEPDPALAGLEARFVTSSAQASKKLGSSSAQDAKGRFPAVLVCLPRSKELAQGWIAEALQRTEGEVFVDGEKTSGIESVFKALRKTPELAVGEAISKAHGKFFSVTGSAEALKEWALPEAPHEIAPGFVTVPGIFSADSIDLGSRFLVENLPDLSGEGADLGAGWGYLAANVLKSARAKKLHLVEDDARALDCARLNLTDERAAMVWADALEWKSPRLLDFVVMNPPFHSGRASDPDLGRAFIKAAADALSPSGRLVMVANRHLAYEPKLNELFRTVTQIAVNSHFKVIQAEAPNRSKPLAIKRQRR